MDPNLSLLYLVSDIAPTLSVDTTWANNLDDYSRSSLSNDMRNSPEIDPPLLDSGFEEGNLPDAGGNVAEPPVPDPPLPSEQIGTDEVSEGDWDII
jgi:hypothetical protein